MKKRLLRVNAVTLIELVISMTVISICLTGVVLVAYYGAAKVPSPYVTQQAAIIAKGYLVEILSQPFPTALPCATPPTLRRNFNDVCDYNNLSNVGAYDSKGNLIPGTSDFNIKVTLDTSSAANLNGYTGSSLLTLSRVVKIDVTVTHKIQGSIDPNFKLVMTAYKGKHS